MQQYDIAIVGGGMVGLSAALAIRAVADLRVAVIEPKPITELSAEPCLRVSAINDASENLLRQLGVWSLITQQRHQAYRHMHVWDKDGIGKLDFSVADGPHLSKEKNDIGHIIENDVIRKALWHKVEQDSGIELINDTITNMAMGESEVFISLAKQGALLSKLLVAADGANSWVRQQLELPLTFRDYDHHAIVATVNVEHGHQDTAWQVFLDTGPLALLPLFERNSCSIVWSLPPEQAAQMMALDPAEFDKRISAASDGKLGLVTLSSERVSFPLTMRLNRSFVKQRAIFIGDAAHTIHPLAGQGVNLGFVDVAAFAQTLEAILQDNAELNDNKAWQKFSRWRKSDAVEMMAAMEAIKQGFAMQAKLPKFIRGIGMSMLNQIKPLKQLMLKHAMGQRSDLPPLCHYKQDL
ncbi:UbiH/UbiF/VisC/COQ6 family ubiquinone biosynthesis hydroxylase [Thalassotalea ponticola]|uniref:UbiH/UbiF/VisC/COQ6 family ubiquinone biosynthesis hydroxylase n=1 Tax=Thalassotalea ponticola TaxID=1523392 RepID=UPI0025B3ED87|nr:UbiH/UbiF/VisC/COQ6 family ubiquinone biosynthesis hydroxylase [Thalassotalea ponticola]MDN3651858.1 UbiH/UbiF/VisC/COQ6 family ubiquinone biosynthesis hydroxylase [Thalassotalea ponticola]